MPKSSGTQSMAGTNAALAGGFLSSGAGSRQCSPDDNSVGCKLNRTVGNVQNLLFLAGVGLLVMYVYKNRKNIFKS